MGWIFRVCIMNMKRRKVRTFLTVLGVVIGVISIVSLLAIGIGVKRELLGGMENSNSIRKITVYGENAGKRKDKMLTDKTIDKLKDLDGVETAYPEYEIFTQVSADKYKAYISIKGIPEEQLALLECEDGSILDGKGLKPNLVCGDLVGTLLYNSKNGMNYIDAEKKQTKDLLGKRVGVTFFENEQELQAKLSISAVLKKSDSSYSMDSQTIFCDLDILKKYLKKNSENGVIYGQETDENGQPLRDFVYSDAVVLVKDLDQVDLVVKKLQDMGFQTENEKEYLEATKKELKIVQFLLGGIGMIALLVAVIGIGNTMTTSVYDRMNEIGVLKILGCDMDELLFLFLLESGILGLFGGVVGILCSFGVKEIINKLVVYVLMFEKGTKLAIIPLWLVVFTLFFSTFLGIVAGYFPAKWASRLKPIETIMKIL